ncbi:hypothetical protein NE865_06617 [Phthorimaea operculella]|nr:hypothetical protein NE865_06617 [Phthorimaea operculella]
MELGKVCRGCEKQITDSFFLRCCVCMLYFDLECANVPDCRFMKTMTRECKNAWKCHGCRGRRLTSDTPVGVIPSPVNLNINAEADHLASKKHYSTSGDEPSILDLSNHESTGQTNVGTTSCNKEHVTFRQPRKRIDFESSYAEETLCVEDIRAVIRQELESILEERLIKVLSKLDQEQAEINIILSQTLKKLTDKCSFLEFKLQTLEEGLSRLSEQPKRSTELPKESVAAQVIEQPIKPKNKKKKRSPKKSDHQPSLSVPSATLPTGSSDLLKGSTEPPTDTSGDVIEPAPEYRPRRTVTSPERENWTDIVKRQRSSVSRVFGTARPGSTHLEAAERVKYIHLYYVKVGTTKEQVQAHLDSICGTGTCSVEALNARGNYASFKLGVPSKQVALVMSPDNWAEDICIKPWRQNFRAKSSQEA